MSNKWNLFIDEAIENLEIARESIEKFGPAGGVGNLLGAIRSTASALDLVSFAAGQKSKEKK